MFHAFDIDNDGVLTPEEMSTMCLINDVTFSQDGQLLAAACSDGSVRLWNCNTWDMIEILDKVPMTADEKAAHDLVVAASVDRIQRLQTCLDATHTPPDPIEVAQCVMRGADDQVPWDVPGIYALTIGHRVAWTLDCPRLN